MRQSWSKVPLIQPPGGKLQRPISMLSRTLRPRTGVAAHSHDWGQLIYAYSGVLDVTTPSGHYLVPPSRAVWVPSAMPHEVSSLCGAELSSVYISTLESQSLGESCYVVEVSNLLRELIIEALRQPVEYQWHGPAGRMLRTLRDQILIAKQVPLHLPLPTDIRLLKLCAELQRNPASKRSLEQWGEYVGASSRTLQRLFQKQTGLSFRGWRQQLRLQVALTKMVSSSDSITRISADLGYESSSTFIAMFRKQLGQTPGEYLKLARRNTTQKEG